MNQMLNDQGLQSGFGNARAKSKYWPSFPKKPEMQRLWGNLTFTILFKKYITVLILKLLKVDVILQENSLALSAAKCSPASPKLHACDSE